tara:strand:- start:221 stop:748 length:528 start_codon:yes stop_codon:yes gene_type:complete
MPKIIKTVGADAIYNNASQEFLNSGKHFGEYNSLADNGDIYIIRGDSEIKEWFAYRCIAPSVSDQSSFYKMLAGYEPTGEVSETFKTKKALTTALEEETAGFTPWEQTPKCFRGQRIKSSSPSRRSLNTATEEDVLALGREMERRSQDLKPILKNPWMIPAILFLGVFFAVVILS